jgi:hypothetical protein
VRSDCSHDDDNNKFFVNENSELGVRCNLQRAAQHEGWFVSQSLLPLHVRLCTRWWRYATVASWALSDYSENVSSSESRLLVQIVAQLKEKAVKAERFFLFFCVAAKKWRSKAKIQKS